MARGRRRTRRVSAIAETSTVDNLVVPADSPAPAEAWAEPRFGRVRSVAVHGYDFALERRGRMLGAAGFIVAGVVDIALRAARVSSVSFDLGSFILGSATVLVIVAMPGAVLLASGLRRPLALLGTACFSLGEIGAAAWAASNPAYSSTLDLVHPQGLGNAIALIATLASLAAPAIIGLGYLRAQRLDGHRPGRGGAIAFGGIGVLAMLVRIALIGLWPDPLPAALLPLLLFGGLIPAGWVYCGWAMWTRDGAPRWSRRMVALGAGLFAASSLISGSLSLAGLAITQMPAAISVISPVVSLMGCMLLFAGLATDSEAPDNGRRLAPAFLARTKQRLA
jgi:hypothetical protein